MALHIPFSSTCQLGNVGGYQGGLGIGDPGGGGDGPHSQPPPGRKRTHPPCGNSPSIGPGLTIPPLGGGCTPPGAISGGGGSACGLAKYRQSPASSAA